MTRMSCSTTRKVLPRVFAQLADVVEDLVDQGWVDARSRLVKQDEIGIAHQRARELDHLLFGVGQVAAILVGHAVEPDHGQQIPRPVELLAFLPAHLRRLQGAQQDPLATLLFRPAEQILQYGHAPEHAHQLEGAGDAGLGDRVRLAAR